jgi:hypothetical protein
MPEEVKAPFFDQSLSGITHDLTDFFAVTRAIAMEGTVFTGRLLFQGTVEPTVNGIEQKILTVHTAAIFFQRLKQIGEVAQENFFLLMMIATIH